MLTRSKVKTGAASCRAENSRSSWDASPEQEQEIEECLGQVALFPVFANAGGADAFAELAAAGSVARKIGRCARTWRIPTKGLIEQNVARRASQPLVPSQHMGDAHFVIVDHGGQMISGEAVRFEQDHIVQGPVVDSNLPRMASTNVVCLRGGS